MQNANAIMELKRTVAPIAKAHGVARVYLFGSRARGTANAGSDFDFRIDKGRIRSLIELSCFRLELEDALGMDIDFVTSDSLEKGFLMKISADEVLIYEG